MPAGMKHPRRPDGHARCVRRRFSGGSDERSPGDGRQSSQPVRRQQTPRRYAHKRHFRYQTVGSHEVEIFVVIVEAGPPDIIDKALRGNAAIDRNDLVVLKLHMPVVEPRRHLLKRQEADRGSVLRQRTGTDLPSWVSTFSPALDGLVAVRRRDPRSGRKAVEDIGPGGGVNRRTAPVRQGREVSVRRVVGDEKLTCIG